MSFIEELELEMWKEQLDKAEAQVDEAQRYADSDPAQIILDCNSKFAKLLEENQGEARLTKSFNIKVKNLAATEKRAKMRMNSFDLIGALDAVNEAKIKRDKIAHKYHMVKFQYDLRRRNDQ